jgi:hypothetical protein
MVIGRDNMMMKRYRLTLDFQVEIDDLGKLALSREGWVEGTPGEFIIENMTAVKRIFEQFMDDPEMLDDYLRHNLVLALSEGFTPEIIYQVSQQLGVELDCEAVIAPVVAKLEGAAARHLNEAQRRDAVINALDKFWSAFKERLVDVGLEEIDNLEGRQKT